MRLAGTWGALVMSLLLGVGGWSASEPTTAVPVGDFLASIGVTSAISARGENLQKTLEKAKYLGLGWIRAGYESDIPVADLLLLHEATGIKFSYGLASGGNDLNRLLDGARQLAAAGALVALEGNNEPNNWGVEWDGEQGGRDLSWLPIAKLQRDLYAAVKADPVLRDYPVWGPSEVGAQTDNVGLQFLTIPAGAGCLMPDGTTYADSANCHNYISHPNWAGLHDNQTWVAADPTSACKVDGLYGNNGLTWRNHFQGYTEEQLISLPKVTTETGITIDGPFTEQVQGLLYLTVYLDQFKRGWNHTAIYLLRDRVDEAGNQTFGFFRPDYSPRLAAIYLHNLTSLLADSGKLERPGTLAYSIPGQPETVHDLLLQKSDGAFCLVVWDERFNGGSDRVTVNFGRRFETVKLGFPTLGDQPILTLSDVESVELTLSNYPVVLELGN